MSHNPDRYEILDSSLGRIVVPEDSVESSLVFWTTSDFRGELDGETTEEVLNTVRDLGGGGERLETCRQVHGTRAIEVRSAGSGWSECDDCDALWTRLPGVALGIKAADCLPVTIVDESGTTINLHAGWRGLAAGILPGTLNRVKGEAPISASASAYLGPSIRICCFEVGEEVVDAFRKNHRWVDDFVDRSRGRPHVDLAGVATRSLIDAGVDATRIWDGELCTRCPDSMFHSFRRSGSGAGRNLAVVSSR